MTTEPRQTSVKLKHRITTPKVENHTVAFIRRADRGMPVLSVQCPHSGCKNLLELVLTEQQSRQICAIYGIETI